MNEKHGACLSNSKFKTVLSYKWKIIFILNLLAKFNGYKKSVKSQINYEC